MRHPLALALALATVACSDPASPSGIAGTCGDAPDGQVWAPERECRSFCPLINGNVRNQTCDGRDGGASYCAPFGSVHDCGDCGNDCVDVCARRSTFRHTAECYQAVCRCNPT